MPARKRARQTLRERGMKQPHTHAPRPEYDEVDCGWCEHEQWEQFRRATRLHDMTFNRYIIKEDPFT